jgi:hypothetical protein
MANLWHNLSDDNWNATELCSAVVLNRGSIEIIDNIHADGHCGDVLLFPHATNTQPATWVLLAPSQSQVRINDTPLENGIRVLANRDAIRVPGLSTIYFSTERLAGVEAFPDSKHVFCARCKLAISQGDSAVCCPQCGVWHHQQGPEGESCWSYAETCALCDQSTDLDTAGFRWTPEGL